MSMAIEDVLIEVSPGETRAALVDRDGQLIGLQIERMGEESQVGAICYGRVTRIEKATQTAFVDIGMAQPGLINRAQGLHEGERLVVQVQRDGWGDKGPAVTPPQGAWAVRIPPAPAPTPAPSPDTGGP